MKNLQPTENFFFYLYFIQERMNIFWRRLHNDLVLTDDPIFERNKFTNAYRVLDRSSQYLLRYVIYNGKKYSREEMFWRILVYKHFNLPHTWDLLIEHFGDINKGVSLDDISEYLCEKIDEGHTIYSNAYMMTSAFLVGDKGPYTFLKHNKWRKHKYYFYIYKEELINQGVVNGILSSATFVELFERLKAVTSMGDFIAYQYAQDLIYSPLFNFDLNDFCAAGPGTQRGIQRTFKWDGAADYPAVVHWVREHFSELTWDFSKKQGIRMAPDLIFGLPMKTPDFSNCFCETDKYMRAVGVKSDGIKPGRMKQSFKPNSQNIEFVFPPKWGNVKLQKI